MAIEIERRFLLKNDDWRGLAQGVCYEQGYLMTEKACTVRVRVIGELAYLTIKGFISDSRRSEYEYEIPYADARAMLDGLCSHKITKRRYKIQAEKGLVWEVDEFSGANAGLILAEIELPDEETAFQSPSWLGAEITHDGRYSNARLAVEPYQGWPQQQASKNANKDAS